MSHPSNCVVVFRRGEGVVLAVMFADTEDVEPDLIGDRALLEDLAERVCLRQLFPLVINRDIS